MVRRHLNSETTRAYVSSSRIVDPLRSNSALLTDTYSSPLRAPLGAAKRGR